MSTNHLPSVAAPVRCASTPSIASLLSFTPRAGTEQTQPEAQQMVTLLGTLAHNLIVWARAWPAASEPKVQR